MVQRKDIEQKVIEQYQEDENRMIHVFAQWCINNDIDPKKLYKEAYPNQQENEALNKVLHLTVSKEESQEISDQLLLEVLQLFGNDDLAFVVVKEIEKKKK